MSRALVVIPTYNERENIAETVARVRAAVPEASVVVVDDSSPDGTGYVAESLAAGDDAVRVLHRTAKDGLGAAYLAAFHWALDRGHDPIVQMDADGSHLPEQLPSLLAALETTDASGRPADLVIGSRWVEGGRIENWPRRREILSRWGSAYARTVLRLSTRDVTAGYRVIRASALRAIRLDDVHTRGYGFQVDMLWHARQAGLVVVEVPITFVERTRGRSKMSPMIVVEAMLKVTGWGIAGLFRRSPAPSKGFVGS
ncbi:glycosyltransferase involved in cell wall biosynthesis [Agromyces terreus]|uniref:Glycosyltransferase involved in cell wall biosynthesis n=1 Tax=Agromyces terreus TaxID=424795 RepID=A0A9X2GW54_9MICO|nr:polyprenol monophosphomannose synthase [Agromyces terreus]MCP2370155.1 glycosyltransferase involved in cell wall biosynthesis [Agromyces terreus]